jgi:hypothetical protein
MACVGLAAAANVEHITIVRKELLEALARVSHQTWRHSRRIATKGIPWESFP